MPDSENTGQKHILCYGDSNTWGYIPAGNGKRMPSAVRWPGALAKHLGDGFRVTEEGLCGRTTVRDDPFTPGIERNGLKTLGTILDTHKPLDLVVLFLGTNDLKQHFSATPDGVAKGVECLVNAVRDPAFGPGNGAPPAVLAICPCAICETQHETMGDFFRGGREKSLELRGAFARMRERCGAPVLYAEDFVSTDAADGIHLSPDSHSALGRAAGVWILEWFAKQAKKN